jgi:hypothetical protein
MIPKLAGAFVTAVLVAVVWVSTSAIAARTRSFVVYAKTTRLQFVNHADDRARGNTTNPFNADTKLPPALNANTGKKGTRAGDNALIQLRLYADPTLTKAIGSAVYSCTFNFAQQATCDAEFQLSNGSMTGSGPADLLGGQFTLAVIGGTGAFLGARGQLSSAPGARKNTVRIDFLLLA